MTGAAANPSDEDDALETPSTDDHGNAPEARAAPASTAPTRPLKRSFSIRGHRTSISLEAAFWSALQEIAALENSTLAGLVASFDAARGEAGLSSAVRIWVLEYYRGRGQQHSD